MNFKLAALTALFAALIVTLALPTSAWAVQIDKSDVNWTDTKPADATLDATTGQSVDCPTGTCGKNLTKGSWGDDPPREPPSSFTPRVDVDPTTGKPVVK